MTTINRIPMTVTGNTNEITYRTNGTGTVFANFDVAQTERFQNPQTGQWEDGATTWIHCTAAGPLAEHMKDSGMQKGARVTVTGYYVARAYQTQDGARRTILELRAEDVAASLRYATVAIHKTTGDGTAGTRHGGRATGEPTSPAPVRTDAADFPEHSAQPEF